MYIDESGMDNREDYGYGWNELGKRYYDLKSGKRSLRVSIVSGLCEGKLVAPLTFEGSCNRVVFEKWLGEKLLPQLKTGQLVILDNASFHKSQKVRELIESVNCELEYLPPYSPDLNEIEHILIMIGVSPPNPKIIGLVQNMKIYAIFRGERRLPLIDILVLGES